MFSLTIARMPSAASSTDGRPMASAIVCTAVARGVDVELHLAAEQPRREVADDDVRVGDRRLGAALAVRGGPGSAPADCGPTRSAFVSSGTWAIDPPPAPTVWTSTDGTLDAEVADRRLAPDRRLRLLAERHVGRRAAHVEREDVVVAGLARDVERARDAAGRPGEHAVDRVPRRLARRHHARVRAQDVDVGRRAEPVSSDCRLLDVVRHPRPHVGVHARGQRPLVLAELGQHVRGERDREARVQALDDLGDLLLVAPVDVGVDQPIVSDSTPDSTRSRTISSTCSRSTGDDRLAARVHPLDRLARVGERGRRVGLDHDDPARERAGRLRAREVEDLLEALRRDQADAGALGLEHGVRRHGRAVKDVADVGHGRCLPPRRCAARRRARPRTGPPVSTGSSRGASLRSRRGRGRGR